MSRPKTRRTLRLESLESRSLLSGANAQQLYMLELINMSRANPAEMATWIKTNVDANDMATMQHYGVDLNKELSDIAGSTPVQPLALNGTLAATADQQSQYEADHQMQTHQGPGEPSLEQRLDAAGYTNRVVDGENSYAYAQSVDHAMKAFLIDWGVDSKGHRGNLLQPGTADDKTYNEVGIGIVATGPGSQVGPNVMTLDFGRQANAQAQLVGVVYNDSDGNHLYGMGEGQGGATIVVQDASGKQVASTTTGDAGGYQIPLAPGSYTVSATANGQTIQTKKIVIGADNVEVDFDLTDDSYSVNFGGSQPDQGGTTPIVTVPTPATVPGHVPTQNQVQISNSTPLLVAGPVIPNFDSSWLSSWTKWRNS